MSPAWLLLLGVVRHQLWEHSQYPALAWNLAGAFTTAALLLFILRDERRVVLWLIGAWWLYEEVLVAVCSGWRMWEWWPVAPGQEQCSARLGVKLGAASMVIVAWLAAILATTPENKKGKP